MTMDALRTGYIQTSRLLGLVWTFCIFLNYTHLDLISVSIVCWRNIIPVLFNTMKIRPSVVLL